MTSIYDLLKKASEGRLCDICNETVPYAGFQRHLKQCNIKIDDDEIQIIGEFSNGNAIKRNIKQEKFSIQIDQSKTLYDKDIPQPSITFENKKRSHKKRISKNMEIEDLEPSVKRVSPETTFFGQHSNTDVVPETPSFQQGILAVREPIINECKSTPTTSKNIRKKEIRVQPRLKKKTNPSEFHPYANLPLEDAYEQLILQLNHLCDAGSKADIVLSQNSQVQLASQKNLNEDDLERPNSKYGPPYVLKYFWRMCLRVLQKDSGIAINPCTFWGENIRILYGLFTMTAEFQEPFVRMLLRDRLWTAPDKIKNSSCASWAKNTNIVTEVFNILGEYQLVDAVTENNIQLEEAVHLLSREHLEIICKHFKLDHRKGRPSLIESILSHAQQKRNYFGVNLERVVFKKALEQLNAYYRIKEPVYNLCHAIFVLFSPTCMDSSQLSDDAKVKLASKLTFNMLNHELNKLSCPAPKIITNCLNIYTKYNDLNEFIRVRHMEIDIIQAKDYRRYMVACKTGKMAKQLLEENYLPTIEFTTPWILMRCVSHMVESLEKLRQYEEAVIILKFLLYTKELKQLCPNARGKWFDRLALNLQFHLKRSEEALDACYSGLKDDAVKEKDKDRAIKLVKDPTLLTPVVNFNEPDKMTIEGDVIGRDLGDQRTNHFILPSNDGTVQKCSVENLVLHHFLTLKGFDEGVHGEGRPWHTLFGLLCWDIIFDHSIESVWFSELQLHPVDLTTPYLYLNRKEKFDARFEFLLNADRKSLEELICKHYEEHMNEENSEVSWNLFDDLLHIYRFFSCCDINMLVALFKRMVNDYRNTRSGFPDLVVWNDATKMLAVIEVKGPGDKLSTKQRLWLDFFSKNSVEAKVCHVIANNNRRI